MSEHGQINNTTERWKIIQDIIKKNDFKNIVEIGTWKGMGSTLCIIESLSKNSKFISIESNKVFYDIAVNNLLDYTNKVNLIYGTIVTYDDVIDFVSELELDNLKKQWLNEDLENLKLCPNVLDIIPDNIDFLLLDGGEFSTYKEWIKLKSRVKILAIDDIRETKTSKIYQELIIDENYNLVEKTDEGNGFCVFEKK